MHSTIITPSATNATTNDARIFAVICTPFLNRAGYAIYGEILGASTIIALLFVCCPSNIARLIVSIYINAVERVSRSWAITESISKLLKRLKQHFYTTTAIICILSVCRSFTSVFSRKISSIFRRSEPTVNGSTPTTTSAMRNAPAVQLPRSNSDPSATVASTQPINDRVDGVFSVNAKHRQHIHSQSGEIESTPFLAGLRGRVEVNATIQIRHIISLTDSVFRLVTMLVASLRAVFIIPQFQGN